MRALNLLHAILELRVAALVEFRVPDAHHEVAEGAVDVLAAALQGRVVGRVDQVDRHVPGLHMTWHNMAQHSLQVATCISLSA